MPRHLTDAQRVDQILPLRITRRLVMTVWDGRKDQRAALIEVDLVSQILTNDLPERKRDTILKRLDRIAEGLLRPFESHRFVAVMAALTLWLNDLAYAGKVDLDFDQPGMRVFADILDAVNETTEVMTGSDTRSRLYRAALASADHLAPLLADRARQMGLYRRQVRR